MIRCYVKASLPELEFAVTQQICNEDLAGRTFAGQVGVQAGYEKRKMTTS